MRLEVHPMRRPYLHIAALLIGVLGVVLARTGPHDALIGRSLPDVGVPALSLPGLATNAQLREQLQPDGVALDTQDEGVLQAAVLPSTATDTQLQDVTSEPRTDLNSSERARVDITPEPVDEVAAASESPLPPESDQVPLRAPDDVTPEDESQTTNAAGQEGLYFNYIVASGDTILSIAAAFGLQADTVYAANLTTISSAALQPGENLRIPNKDGILHPVQPGDTVSGLAERYGTTTEAIIGYAANGIASPDDLVIGSEILVVGGSFITPPPAPADEAPADAAPADAPAGENENPFAAQPAPADAAPADAAPADAAPADAAPAGEENPFAAAPLPDPSGGAPAFIWPFTGEISSFFGPEHPLGIDLDGFGQEGAAVTAAADGVVVFAGGDPGYSYGYYVIVAHSGGFETLYGHLSSISVSVGEPVAAGQALGTIGSTGTSTGTHLHFEVRQDGAYLNPMVFLP